MEKLKSIQKQINKIYQNRVIQNELKQYYNYLALAITDNQGNVKTIALYPAYNLIKIFLDGNNVLYFEKVSSVMDYLKCNVFGE